jgi:hypothetical protein
MEGISCVALASATSASSCLSSAAHALPVLTKKESLQLRSAASMASSGTMSRISLQQGPGWRQ